MTEPVSDRCGYTWPEDHKVDDEPNRQSCCWREVVDGSEYCIWHANPGEVSKSVERLQQACAPPELREQNSPVAELIDGAQLAGLTFGNVISFQRLSLRKSNFSDSIINPDADFTSANLMSADFTNTNLRGNFTRANLMGANLTGANLMSADLTDTNLWHTNLTNALFPQADLTEAHLWNATLTNADLRETNLTDAFLNDANLTNANLRWANLTHTSLKDADLTGTNLISTDLTGADLSGANLTDVDLRDADLLGTKLSDTNLTGAHLQGSNLTDTNFSGANLTAVSLEHTICVRTNLFSVNLTNCKTHGSTLTDVQLNHDTELRSNDRRRQEARLWQKGPFFPPQRCGYDPVVAEEKDDLKLDQLAKAADTYQSFEKLARENARPSLQSEMFVLRQDMQRKRHWHNRDYFEWGFAQISRTVFNYGESLGRIITVAVAVIVAYAAIYSQFDLIRDAGNQFVVDPIDALYFSTLTFTTLGLGDFQPEPTSQAARLLVTSQAASGAVLISIFVFVLGRRAAR
ncbi:pentapeptide repeat-containing protein [Halorubrum ezzemoulense]|uniref:pentapeptide repeat-containing protein n=1 Tax=Halorubrum ezzemoulense TaxID=337243 RepID=UPI00232CC20D|nr:pentapeptide repeat-containing protein [Halorubrum ezzemoulense]MDB2272343.1 pentapeptide repeat-containing protein [Halorubrum ezzemoulense]